MLEIKFTAKFKRDYKKVKKQGKDVGNQMLFRQNWI